MPYLRKVIGIFVIIRVIGLDPVDLILEPHFL